MRPLTGAASTGDGRGERQADTVVSLLPVTELLGYAAIALSAIAAVTFLMLGGTYHPQAMLATAAVCAGLSVAVAERSVALFRQDRFSARRTNASSAVVMILVLAVFWVPFSFYPLSILLAAFAATIAWARHAPWIPLTIMLVAGLHLALALWMLIGSFEFASREDGALPNPMFWPVMASCLAALSSMAIVSAVQIRRRSTTAVA